MTTSRITQATTRIVSNANPVTRVTQTSVRVVSSAINHTRITQCQVRVVSANTPDGTGQVAWPQLFVCT